MSVVCYKLCDLIDIVEELLATVKALPEGTLLQDSSDQDETGVPVILVIERLKGILRQLLVEQKGLD